MDSLEQALGGFNETQSALKQSIKGY